MSARVVFQERCINSVNHIDLGGRTAVIGRDEENDKDSDDTQGPKGELGRLRDDLELLEGTLVD